MLTNFALRKSMLVVAFTLLYSLPSPGMAKDLSVMLVSYPRAVQDYLKTSVVPAFEARYGTKVNFVTTDWTKRTDKLTLLIAGGSAPDVVVTGYYSSYEEGSLHILAPLDEYLAKWKYTARFPKSLWDAVRWQGKVMVVPQNLDIRGLGYNKDLFAQSGYDAKRTPKSWDELISYTKRLTRMNGDKVSIRGLAISRYGQGAAQELFWFIHQAGLTELNPNTLTSNLNHAGVEAALRTLINLDEATHGELGLESGNFYTENIAMQRLSPTHALTLMKSNPDMLKNSFGLFPPQQTPNSVPVAHTFINGLAITQASKNKDLAWEFIATLMEDEHVYNIQLLAGWIGGRVDLAHKMSAVQPGFDLWYAMFDYLRSSFVPPPRDIAQEEIGNLLVKAYGKQMSPQVVLEQAHSVWSRLLLEWKALIVE